MKLFLRIFTGVLALFAGLVALSMAAWGAWGRAALLLAAVATLLFGRTIFGARHRILTPAATLVLLAAVAAQSFGPAPKSIYLSSEVRDRFRALYAGKMADWPVPYRSETVETGFGSVHVIVSGPENGPPMLLLHASGVASWSWKYNVAALSGPFRTYAIDLVGDAGLSEFSDLGHVFRDGRDQADHYAAVMDRLAIESAVIVGASEGGFIASNLAIHRPERVRRLILLGPMGYSGAVQAVLRITLTQMFPIRALQDSTFRWAFSDDPTLHADYAEWFPLLMEGVTPRKLAPLPLSAAERQSITQPVLFVFGERDNLVGDPGRAAALVSDMPDATVEIVPAGHLMAAEIPDVVTPLVLGFALK